MKSIATGCPRHTSVRTLQHVGQLLLAMAALVMAGQTLIEDIRKGEPDETGPDVARQEDQ